MKRGRMIYVPHDVLDEIDQIMQHREIEQRAEAMNEMVKYSQVGREAERILKLDFSDTIFPFFKKRKK